MSTPPSSPDIDVQTLRAHLSAATYQRAQGICREQLIRKCEISPLGQQQWRITGTVQGSTSAPYKTIVHLRTQDRGRLTAFEGDCSCPVGQDCKHAAALVLHAAALAQDGPLAQQRVARWLEQFTPDLPGSADSDLPGEAMVFLLHLPHPAQPDARPMLSWGWSRARKEGGWRQVRPPAAFHTATPEHASEDEQACAQLIGALDQGRIQGQTGLLALELAARSGKLFLATPQRQIDGKALAWGPGRPLAWRWDNLAEAPGREPVWALRASLPAQQGQLFAGHPALYLDTEAHLCGEATAPGMAPRQLGLLLQAPPLPQSVFEQQQHLLLPHLADLPLPPTVQAAEALQGITPLPCLHITAVPVAQRARLGPLCLELSHDYAGLRRYWEHRQSPVMESSGQRRVLLHRHLIAEREAQDLLKRLGLDAHGQGRHHLRPGHPGLVAQWLEWAAENFEPLRAAGLVVTQGEELAGLVQHVDALDFRLTDASGLPLANDALAPDSDPSHWFGLSLGMEIGGVRQDVLPWLPGLLAQWQATAPGADLPPWIWLPREDGSYLHLPSAPLKPWIQVLIDLLDSHRPQDGLLRLSRLDALRVGAALDRDTPWAGATGLRALLERLGGHAQLPPTPVPSGLQAQLRPYQHRGLDWLQFLRAQGLCGILADDMGLGKTLQTLAHLLAEKEAGRLDRPALVIVPVSLLGNWQREAARFAPALATLVWHGSRRHGIAQQIRHSDLVIAPYSLLQRDRAMWLEQPWHITVLDEAQNIKNASTQAAQVVSELDTRHRLCLSGTPLENHLGELWSLFHFLMPGFLGSQARFGQHFRTPIEKHGDRERLDQLRRRITPFLLRRTKSEVATELPEKVENITFATLQGPQADLYETIRLATEKTVRDALASKGLARSQIEFLDALLKLRQACCDPRLLKAAAATPAGKAMASAKLDLLMELLPEMLAEGRRVLLFSQFTSMLSLIEEALKARGIAWTKLTGQTQRREAAIERFTSGQVPVFLISLKAGGTGLNLPQADTVIHYDPWWNPAVEEQATSRAHRIGQTSQVFVYKLVAQGTIEERILALQSRKAALSRHLLQGAVARREPLFTEQDVAELLKPLG